VPATTLPEPWRALAAALGGVAQLAEACGVTTRTLQRWARAELTPGPIVQKHVRTLAKRRGLAEPWA
jgi:hypothetical protein